MALVTAAQFDISANPLGAIAAGQNIRATEQALNIQRQQFEAEQQQRELETQRRAQSDALARAAMGIPTVQGSTSPTTPSIVPGQQRAPLAPDAQPAPLGREEAFNRLLITDPDRAKQIQDAQKQRFDLQDARSKFRIRSVVQGAAEAKASSNPLETLRQRRQSLASQGLDTSDTDQAISLYEQGRDSEASDLLDRIVTLGQQLDIIKAPSLEREKLDIQRATLGLRAAEIEQRNLDRQLGRETNQLKREELQSKIDSAKREAAQAKRDVEFEAENAVSGVQSSIDTVDRLLEGEGLESAAGVSSVFPTVPGSRAADFEAQLETLQSQAFLTQVEKMKGLGALSENEGKKLGAAIGSLDLRMSDAALRKELKRIKTTLDTAKQRIEKKFDVTPVDGQAPKQSRVGRFTIEVE